MYFSRSPVERSCSPNDQVEQRYVYNSEERLSEVKDATDQTIASYYYDPFGRRLWKTVAPNQPGNDSASPKTTYLYYTDEGYAAEYTHNGNHSNSEATITPVLSQLYLFAPQGLWSTEPVAIKQAGEQGGWRYPETDHLGTPHGLISKDGTETTDLRANAFGQTEVSGEPLPLRFAGQTEDDETGGYYNFHRDYEPGLGRYRESDPIGLEGGQNYYTYAHSNSIVYFDPTGEIAPAIWVVASVVGSVGLDLWDQVIVEGVSWECLDIGQTVTAGIIGLLPSGVTYKAYKAVKSSSKAIYVLNGQLQTAKAMSRITKLHGRISSHEKSILKNVGAASYWWVSAGFLNELAPEYSCNCQ